MKLKKLVSALVSCAMILGTMAAVPVFAEESTGTDPVEEFMSLKAQSVNDTHEIDLNGAIVDVDGEYWSNIYADITIKNGTINFSDFTTSDGIFRIGYYSCNHPVTLTLENMTINVTDVTASTGVFTMQNQDDTLVLNNSIINATDITGTPGIFYTSNGVDSVRGSVEITDGSLSVETDSALFFNNDVDLNGTTISCTVGRPVFRQSAGSVEDTTITVNAVIYDDDGAKRGIVEDIAGNPDGTVEFKNSKVVAREGQTFVKANTTGKVLAIADKASTYTVGETVNPMASEETGVKLIVASINGKSYATLAAALDAAQDSETVKVLDDITLTNNIYLNGDKAIKLDLNGKTLSCEGGRIVLSDGTDMTVTGNGYISADLSKGSQTAIEVHNDGSTLTIKSANVSAGANNMIFAAGYGGSIIIDGGTYTVTDGGTCFYVFDNSKLTINNGIFNGTGNDGTGIVWAFNGSDVEVNNGTFNVANDTYPYPGITSNVNWTFCDYRGLIGFRFPSSLAVSSKGNIQVYGGTYNVDPNKMSNLKWELIDDENIQFHSLVVDYVAPGYVSTENADGTYTVAQSEAKIIDTAKTTGATVTLDNLTKNAAVDHEPDATYKVVVETAPKADVDAVNKAIEDSKQESTATPDNNTSKAMFDISVVKVDSNGVETDLGGTEENSVKNQKVTLTLGETPSNPNAVRVYHVVGNSVTEIKPVTVSGNTVTFTAPSFSTYAVTYNAEPVAESTITDEVGVVFSPVSEGSNQYYITLKSLKADKKINRFMSTDLVFKNACDTVDYDITPATNMTASVVSENGASREYRFNMDGTNQSGASSEIGGGITIGTITFYGYGELDFSVNKSYSSGHAVNIVNTATATNNIVASYMIDGGLIVNDDVIDNLAADEKGTIKNVTLAPETKDLTVNIAYNNKINNNEAAYQDMTVTISGGDLSGTKTVELGTDPKFSDSFTNRDATNKVLSTATFEDNTYKLNIKGELTQNVSYIVTVEGAGYRTARYTVTMTTNKTLNFWNNVMDANTYVEASVGTPSKTNFLAGDIVKDNNINIYDLSAVVSYFGENDLVTDHQEYAKYDLNRDGVIDSKDVAYVLVSWGK